MPVRPRIILRRLRHGRAGDDIHHNPRNYRQLKISSDHSRDKNDLGLCLAPEWTKQKTTGDAMKFELPKSSSSDGVAFVADIDCPEDASKEEKTRLPTCAYMSEHHAEACEAVCTLWRAGTCQNPAMSKVFGRKTDRCVRPLQKTLHLASEKRENVSQGRVTEERGNRSRMHRIILRRRRQGAGVSTGLSCEKQVEANSGRFQKRRIDQRQIIRICFGTRPCKINHTLVDFTP